MGALHAVKTTRKCCPKPNPQQSVILVAVELQTAAFMLPREAFSAKAAKVTVMGLKKTQAKRRRLVMHRTLATWLLPAMGAETMCQVYAASDQLAFVVWPLVGTTRR